jgi:metal-responsive CopG/Arc/MetJ family transcriptional regulator
MNSPKPKGQTIIAFKAEQSLAAQLDRVVRELDTDRSKFIRAAVRKEIAKSKAG